jgi:hypothetical protein
MMDNVKAGRGLLAGVPKHARIKGQDHELIYATEDEQDVLVRRGGGRNPDGSQVYGPKGVKAFPEPGMGGSNDNGPGSESTGGSTGGGEGNNSNDSDPTDGGVNGVDDGSEDSSDPNSASVGNNSADQGGIGGITDADVSAAVAGTSSASSTARDMFEFAVKAFTRFGMIGYAEDVGRKVEAELEERGINVDTARADEYGGFTGTGTSDMPGDDAGGTGPGGGTDPMMASTTAPTAAKRTDVQPSGFRGLLSQTSTRVGPNGLYI